MISKCSVFHHSLNRLTYLLLIYFLVQHPQSHFPRYLIVNYLRNSRRKKCLEIEIYKSIARKNTKTTSVSSLSPSIIFSIIIDKEAQGNYVFCHKLITYDNCILVCPKQLYKKNKKIVPPSPLGASPFCLSWRAITARNRKQRKSRVPWRQSFTLNYRGSPQYRML